MGSRMEKYHRKREQTVGSRTKRNEELYQHINKSDLAEYNVNSNVSVLGVSGNDVDVQQIKEILAKKYHNPIKRKSIKIEKEEPEESVPLETKDYDLSKILEKARAEKPVDYRKERLKKLRDTQYDILKQLNLEKKEEPEPTEEEQTLMTMIETINNQEKTLRMNTSAELELLSDLQGSEDTVVIPPITKELKENCEEKEEPVIDDSFYTDSIKIKEEDFEDFEDLKKEINSNSTVIKILIVLFSIIVLAGIFFALNKIFNWGLFREAIQWIL